MLSFRIRGGNSAANRFCEATRIFTLAESLGGVESLIEVPASMTHMGIPKEQREAAGVFDDLVRISCGVEVSFFFLSSLFPSFPLFSLYTRSTNILFFHSPQDSEDLVADILQALEKVVSTPSTSSTNGTSSSTT